MGALRGAYNDVGSEFLTPAHQRSVFTDRPVGMLAFGTEVSPAERAELRQRAQAIIALLVVAALLLTLDLAVLFISASRMPLGLDFGATSVQAGLGVSAGFVLLFLAGPLRQLLGPQVKPALDPSDAGTPWQQTLVRQVAEQNAAAAAAAQGQQEAGLAEEELRGATRPAPPLHPSVAAVHPAEVHEVGQWRRSAQPAKS